MAASARDGFATQAEAVAFDEGISGGAKARSSTPNIYPYETSDGTRWRYSYRESPGRLSTKRGFLTERAAARDREERMARVRQSAVVVSRATFGEFSPRGCVAGGLTSPREPGRTTRYTGASAFCPTLPKSD